MHGNNVCMKEQTGEWRVSTKLSKFSTNWHGSEVYIQIYIFLTAQGNDFLKNIGSLWNIKRLCL